jgi:hypothetical protein
MEDDKKTAAHVRLELRGPRLRKVEDWRRSQPTIPSRHEAISQLLDKGLEVSERPAA